MGATKQLLDTELSGSTQAPATGITWHTDNYWTSTAQDKVLAALLAFHREPVSITKDRTVPVGGGRTRSYTTLDEIIAKTKPALAKHGLMLIQSLAGPEVITQLLHVSGQFIASKVGFIPMQGNNTNALQNAGGGLTYLKRYAISALLNLNSEDDDDAADSHAAVLPHLPESKMQEVSLYLANGGKIEQVLAKYQITATQLKQLTEA
jgi:hypothetical protein